MRIGGFAKAEAGADLDRYRAARHHLEEARHGPLHLLGRRDMIYHGYVDPKVGVTTISS